MPSYLTLARGAEVEIEVKRSRFLATLRRVGSEDVARAVVDELRRTHGGSCLSGRIDRAIDWVSTRG